MIRNIMALQRSLPRLARTSFRSASLASCAAASLGSTTADAAILDWHGDVDAKWSTATNWEGNVPPVSGSPNLEVRLKSPGTSSFTSNQDLGSPFELQQLSVDTSSSPSTHHTIDGSPLAFSNLGSAPIIRNSGDPVLAMDLTINADMTLNADLTVQAAQSGTGTTIYLNGTLSGAGGLVTAGGGNVRIGGTMSNAYAGLTNSTAGEIYLEKPSSVTAIPGDLVIHRVEDAFLRSGRVYVMNDEQIAASAKVSLDGGTLYVQGGNQTLANVEFTGYNSTFLINADGGSIEISPSRTLTVTGGVTRVGVYNPTTFAHGDSSILGGTIDLNGGVRPFRVESIVPESIGMPSFLTVTSDIVNGDIEKTGKGVLYFSGLEGSFSGNLTVNEGLLRIGGAFQTIFGLQDGGLSNRIAGSANAEIAGIFNIDPSSVSGVTGVWNLVDVASLNETFESGLKLQLSNGSQFTKFGSTYRMGRWSFSTVTGDLTLAETPEPATLGMGAMAALLVGAMGRRMGAKGRTAST